MNTYKESGRLGLLMVPLFIIFWFVSAVTGVFYQILIKLMPWMVITFLLTLVAGLFLGFVGKKIILWGKSRNTKISLLFLAIAACVFVFFSHLNNLFIHNRDKSLMELLVGFFPLLKSLAMEGLVITRSSTQITTITGFWFYLIWLVELVMILGITLLIGYEQNDAPFCESCGKWCDKKIETLSGVPVEDAKTHIEQSDLEKILTLPKVGDSDKEEVKLTCYYCPTCLKSGFLSVEAVYYMGHDSDGEPKKNENFLVENAVLSPELRQRFLDRMK